jgi:hypothetical protein
VLRFDLTSTPSTEEVEYDEEEFGGYEAAELRNIE